MYIVRTTTNNQTLTAHETYIDGVKLRSGEIAREVNSIDSFQFSLYQNNPAFDNIYPYATTVQVYNTVKQRIEFNGRVLIEKVHMEESGLIYREVTCESCLGYLCDSQQPYTDPKNWTLNELLSTVINNHNSQVESHKQFQLGNITMEAPNDNIYVGIQRENSWTTLQNKLVDKIGGEFSFRSVDGVLYLDYNEQTGSTKSTTIELAKNMQSITRENDPTSFITRLIPLGAKITEEAETETQPEEETSSEARVGIESVNDGLSYVDDTVAIGVYGIIVGYQTWDDVTEPANLLTKAQNWLADNNRILQKFTVTALDLSLIGLDIDDFALGNYYPVKNDLIGVDDTLRIIKMNINVIDPYASKFDIGDSKKTLSDIQIGNNNAIKNEIGEVVSEWENGVPMIVEEEIRNSSLIQQMPDQILMQVEENYTLKSETEELRQSISTEMEQTAEGWTFQFNQVSEQVTEINGVVETNFSEITKYIRFEAGNIILGVVGNDLTLKIQNDRISFLQNGVEVAYFSNQKMYVTDGEFLNSLILGNFAFLPRSNGNLSFTKVR